MMLAAAWLSGCATQSVRVPAGSERAVIARFSSATPGGTLPGAWAPWRFGALKKPTEYVLVDEDGTTVVRALAEGSASGLIHPLRVDPNRYPLLVWRWKIADLIDKADNTKPLREDSPVRIVVAFEGDHARLPLADRMASAHFRLFTKSDLPFATLMYIWENRAEAGSIIPSAHTSRIRMIVAESGQDRVGRWSERTVNLVEDFRRAFGETPPPIKWIGIMTDTDNTGARALAYYGDIELRALPR